MIRFSSGMALVACERTALDANALVAALVAKALCSASAGRPRGGSRPWSSDDPGWLIDRRATWLRSAGSAAPAVCSWLRTTRPPFLTCRCSCRAARATV